jgi:hypothetical protein
MSVAEKDMKNNGYFAAILLLNQAASARQIVGLDYEQYFNGNRLCLTEAIDARIASTSPYEYDPFGRKVKYVARA